MRRTKDSLTAVALRLQVAIKVVQDDEQTINQLQNETMELRTNCIASNRQQEEAAELISNLNLTIMTLKRKLKTAEDNKIASQPKPNDQADSEVLGMLAENNSMEYTIPPGTGGNIETAAPFDRWKMQQVDLSLNNNKHMK